MGVLGFCLIIASSYRELCHKYLLTYSPSQDGVTPLYMASQEGHTTTVDVLLRQGADPNIANKVRKFNPYHILKKLEAIMLPCNKFTSCIL